MLSYHFGSLKNRPRDFLFLLSSYNSDKQYQMSRGSFHSSFAFCPDHAKISPLYPVLAVNYSRCRCLSCFFIEPLQEMPPNLLPVCSPCSYSYNCLHCTPSTSLALFLSYDIMYSRLAHDGRTINCCISNNYQNPQHKTIHNAGGELKKNKKFKECK